MKSRRQAREAVLQALYQCDSLCDWNSRMIAPFFSHFIESTAEGADNIAFAQELLHGIFENLDAIDELISSSSANWSLSRMSRVDRNIIRLATYEICFRPEIPKSVSINEAIEIAKRFGSDDSPMFVNGVLDKSATLFSQRAPSAENVPPSLKKVANG